jgi:hypothetical protein
MLFDDPRCQTPNGSNGSKYFFEVVFAMLSEEKKSNWKKSYLVPKGSNGSKFKSSITY